MPADALQQPVTVPPVDTPDTTHATPDDATRALLAFFGIDADRVAPEQLAKFEVEFKKWSMRPQGHA